MAKELPVYFKGHKEYRSPAMNVDGKMTLKYNIF